MALMIAGEDGSAEKCAPQGSFAPNVWKLRLKRPMRLKGPYHNRLAGFVGPTHLIFVTLNPLAPQSFRLILQS
jgi:hypothetical protein